MLLSRAYTGSRFVEWWYVRVRSIGGTYGPVGRSTGEAAQQVMGGLHDEVHDIVNIISAF